MYLAAALAVHNGRPAVAVRFEPRSSRLLERVEDRIDLLGARAIVRSPGDQVVADARDLPRALALDGDSGFPGMAKMGLVGLEIVDWFNSGLFDDDTSLPSRTPTRHHMIRMRGLRG